MKKGFLPAFILFGLVTVAVLIFRNQLYAAGIDAWVVFGGNVVFFVAAMLSMYVNAKAMAHKNTHGFIKNVYAALLLKFFIVIVAMIAYIVLGKDINMYALLICLGLNLLYTILGTRNVLNNKKPVTDGNGKSTV